MAAILALMLFLSTFWRPSGCGSLWSPCLSVIQSDSEMGVSQWEELDLRDTALRPCPGQSFQSTELLRHLRASLGDEGDVLLEPYLRAFDQLILFMESLGSVVGFFSHKVKEKVSLIRRLAAKHAEESGKQGPYADGLKHGAYRSVRSMVDFELAHDLVGFSFRTDSGCRTVLRLHRSLLWVKLVLQGLTEDPDHDGVYKTPGEIGREAYAVALAPHHSWLLRSAAELVFVALPDRKFFLSLVCVNSQSEAKPALHIVIRGLTLLHQRTQNILEPNGLLDLP